MYLQLRSGFLFSTVIAKGCDKVFVDSETPGSLRATVVILRYTYSLLEINNIDSSGFLIEAAFSFFDPVAGTSRVKIPRIFGIPSATGTEYAESRVSRAPPPRPLRKANN